MKGSTVNRSSDVLDKLRKIPIFEQIKDNDDHMQRLFERTRLREFHSNDVIIKENDLGSEMYIVFSGSVEIQKRTRAGDDYTVVILNAEQNVFFGEIGLLLNDRRSATVVAEDDSVFLMTTRDKFKKFGESESYVALLITRQIAQILARRLFKTNQDVVTLFSALVSEIDTSGEIG
jgi:CRP-like cAMP-binding protein